MCSRIIPHTCYWLNKEMGKLPHPRKEGLPEEVISCSDVYSFLNKNLIEKQYYSSDQQTYRITVLCGKKLLLQNQKGEYEIRELAEMFRERRHCYEQKSSASAAEKRLHKGVYVIHSEFGIGLIRKVKHGIAFIHFEDHPDIWISLQEAVFQNLIRYYGKRKGEAEED